MSRHAKRTRANDRERLHRAERKGARRKARQKKLGFAPGGLLGERGPESLVLPAGTRLQRG